MTRIEFIKKVKDKYYDKYDCSLVEYKNNKIKVKIICNRCGNIFEIRPNDLLNGSGCKNCRKFFNKTTYVKKFIKKHGTKYDYSLMSDNKLFTKDDIVYIICPIHGTFEQKIKNHLQGNGCKLCGLEKSKKSRLIDLSEIKERLNTLCEKEFIFNFEEYKNTNTPIKLICKNCGNIFFRDINALMCNNSCPYCNNKKRNITYNNNEFINKANEIHNNIYDYTKTEYKKTDIKVCITCHKKDLFGDEHGDFWVTPHAHIGKMKSGCPKCSGKYKKTTNDFIKESNLIHDNYYDYSEVNYINAKTKVKIICPEHGEFFQTPNSHLSGEGCPICKQSSSERKLGILFKNNNIEFIRQYKPLWLKRMSIDFFIPKYNIGIEVQGYQHFQPVKYWGGDKTFEKILERDNKKRELCEENGVKLLYYSELKINFPYYVITNIDDLLKEIEKYSTKNLEN